MIIKFEEYVKESSDFNQWGSQPLGPGMGFANDPGLAVYNNDTSPYQDAYSRTASNTNTITRIAKQVFNDTEDHIFARKNDRFLLDIDEYKNIKILRMFQNENLKLNVYISFDFMDQEFFGVFRNFNSHNKPKLDSEIFGNPNFSYMDKEYYLKLNQYFYKKISNFFIPEPGLYINQKQNNIVKSDDMGTQHFLKDGKIVNVLGYNLNESGDPFIAIDIDGKKFNITGNDYYFFKWRFEKANQKSDDEI